MTTTTTPTKSSPPVRLGWIGLGNMGIGMARNIQRHIAASASAASAASVSALADDVTKSSLAQGREAEADASAATAAWDTPADEEDDGDGRGPQHSAVGTGEEVWPPLRVYNRTASRCEGVEELGGVRCGSVAEVLEGSDVVFLSLSDDAAVLAMIETLVATPDTSSATPSHSHSHSHSQSQSPVKGKIIIDTTTVHPDTTKRVTQTLTDHGARFAAMPVFGPAPVAAAGQLIAAFAGPADVLEVISPVLKGVIAREVMVVGDEPEKAVLLKTTSNLLTATMTQAIAEAHVFAAKTGLPASTLERLLELNLGPYAHLTSQRMTSGVYCPAPGTPPWSDLALALKDVGHGVDTAAKRGMRLRAGEATLESLRMARAWAERNGGDGEVRSLDSSSLFGAIREENGLDFENDVVKERDGKKEKEENGGEC
ncbi:hypothetical protein Micbo1qcDRAFT_235982 [Microdochium bolleyi]|uniref:6-phosphogluconate dehydrogenase NADP-binding domain-containing protein n=1 Tax=Microdochium bolleyi TaxID=196109 RepID=A0A136ITJ5_9PEZI|nr:hypothetical protein Micbo1qcDRAFT_235982 [Microdochium bolleyi]